MADATRTGASLRISFPPELPVSQRRAEIAAAIAAHQVVVVAGETGSGKTTQLPKICLELGRGAGVAPEGRNGRGGVIGHTQPRRIAARTVADRIAWELSTELGDVVGYQVRFTDRSGPDTRVKVMTDGILLAEIQRDTTLTRYDTIIVDEAHERSLNSDFILGYLKQLLPRRPDLKLVVTSATIDVGRFSRHFDDAPVIEVSGRTYPVEVRYREPDEDQTRAVREAVRELMDEGPGDILVFFSGEREIRDAAEALQRLKPRRPSGAFEVLPLFARLSAAEQHRVFAAHQTRRIVLATNVAETSLTVPGIRYVVDTGLARISRYSSRTKVQRLPIEPIARASANQRAGRCGREAAGVCIRLYAEDDFAGRPEFTDPEILRTSLASVILQMTALGLGDIARFPFVDPPDPRSVRAGRQLLVEIGALRDDSLTKTGRQLARLPVDPRLGRMMIEAHRNGCLTEVMTIVAGLSIQDPRERPADQQERADTQHRRFADPSSDFAAILNLWKHVREQQQALSSSAFRRLCRTEYLNYLRIREWQDLVSQLRQVSTELGLATSPAPASTEAIHRSLLAGLLSHIGMKDGERRDYLGARGTRFAVFPGSGLFTKQPEFLMAAELVETGRLWARMNAAIDPAWAESAAAHLVRRSFSEPHWEKNRGSVVALEKVTLYGVPIVSHRKVGYGRIDAALSRELFIRHALVQGEWTTRHRFYEHNEALREQAEDLENRARRRGIVVDDDTLFAFYDARVGTDVVSTAHFDSWWEQARRDDSDLLTFTPDMLVSGAAADVRAADYPAVWRHGDVELPLVYAFAPGSHNDGVTVDVPVAALPQVAAEDFSWPVPGLREDLVVALIRSLPKGLRTRFVPAPDHARRFLDSVTPGEEPLLDALERYLRRHSGEVVPRAAWDLGKIPTHLLPTFRVVSEAGETLAQGKALETLSHSLRDTSGAAVSAAAAEVARDSLERWDFGELPRTFSQTRAGHEVRGYPALVDEGTGVSLRVLATREEQDVEHRWGVVRLLTGTVRSPVAGVVKRLDNRATLRLGLHPVSAITAVVDDCYDAAVDLIVQEAGGPAWTRAEFDLLADAVRARGAAETERAVELTGTALESGHAVARRLTGRVEIDQLAARTDLRGQLDGLIHRGFVTRSGLAALRRYPRYLAAMQHRLDRLAVDPRRDAVLMGTVAGVQEGYRNRRDALPARRRPTAALEDVRWMIEELRVSLWAQQLRTAYPVSAERVERALRDT